MIMSVNEQRMNRTGRAGFTLIELIIVVTIVAILALIAYPSYINSITRSKRAAATACLSSYATFMERFYTTNLRYDVDTEVGRAHVCTPVTNAHLVCRLLLGKNTNIISNDVRKHSRNHYTTIT